MELTGIKKVFFFLLISVVCFTTAEAQQPLNYVFNNRDDIYNHRPDGGTKPYYWNGGILYLGFCYDSSLTHEGTTITFYDTLGNLKWKDTILNPNYPAFQGNDIIAINNSSFYIGGIAWKDTTTQWDMFFAKFDTNGDSVFCKIYTDSTSNWFMNFDALASDTLLLLSNWGIKSGDQFTKIILYKMDTLGNILATDSSKFTLKAAYQVLKGPDNRIYVGGYAATDTGSDYNVYVFINVYDYNLKQIADWYPGLTINEYFDCLNIWNNQLYLTSSVSVFLPPNANNFYQCRVGKITNGEYSEYNNFGFIYFWSFEGSSVVLDNNCLVIPFTNGYDSLYFVDTTLNIICMAPFGYPLISANDYVFSSIEVLPNKEIAGTGIFWADSTHSEDHWNFLTENIEDYLKANCSATGVAENSQTNLDLILYPNPASNKLTIQTSSFNNNEAVTISVMNLLGEVIQEEKVKAITASSTMEYSINIINLPVGIYFMQLTSEQERWVGKFLKE